MKQFLTYILALISLSGFSQSAFPTVINSGGGSGVDGNLNNWQYSIGETVTFTGGPSPVVTNGFNQPLAGCIAPLVVTLDTDNDPLGDGSGECGDLRYAIYWANNNSVTFGVPDEITFAIPTGPYRIGLSSELPPITDELIIRGRSQNSAIGLTSDSLNANHGIEIIVDGNQMIDNAFIINSDNVTIRGLSIVNFRQAGIFAELVKDFVVEGCFIGIEPDGIEGPNAIGIHLNTVLATDASNFSSRIGGVLAKDINVISGNDNDGVLLENCDGIGIIRNFIGLDPLLTTTIPNKGDGINLKDSRNIQIGADVSGAFNYIASNGSSSSNHQIFIEGNSDNITITHNKIGLLANNTFVPSVGDGVNSAATGSVLVGSPKLKFSNYIAGGNNGIDVGSTPATLVLKNAIYSNTNLGIVNINEIPDPIVEIAIEGTDTLIKGTTNNGVTLIQVYADSEDEGQVYLGDATINSTEWELTFTKAMLDRMNTVLGTATTKYLTYTASSTPPMGNRTSQFSEPILVDFCNALLVTETTDDGSCGTLRGAINYVNANAGPHIITFELNNEIIVLESTLKITGSNVLLDGGSDDVIIKQGIPFTSVAYTNTEGTSLVGRSIMFDITGSDVDLRDLTILDEPFVEASGEQSIGVFYNVGSNNSDLSNVVIEGFEQGVNLQTENHRIDSSEFVNNKRSIFAYSDNVKNLTINYSIFQGGSTENGGGVYLEFIDSPLSGANTERIWITQNTFYNLFGDDEYAISNTGANTNDIVIAQNSFGKDDSGVPATSGMFGINLGNIDNVLIQDNEFEGNATAISITDKSTDLTILRNTIINGGKGVEAIRLNQTNDILITQNSIYNVTDEVISNPSAIYIPEITNVNVVAGEVTGVIPVGITLFQSYTIELFATNSDESELFIGSVQVSFSLINSPWKIDGLETILDTLSYDFLTATATLRNNTSPLSAPVAIYPCQFIATAGNDTTMCSPVSIQLDGGVSTPATSGTWNTAGLGAFSDANDSLATYTFAPAELTRDSMVFVFTPTGAGGCKVNPDTMVVHFAQPPVFDLGLDTVSLCGEDTIVRYSLELGETITWSNNVLSNVLSTSDSIEVNIASSMYYATLDSLGCTAIDSFYFQVLQDLPDDINNLNNDNNDLAVANVVINPSADDENVVKTTAWYKVGDDVTIQSTDYSITVTMAMGPGFYYFINNGDLCKVTSDTVEVINSSYTCTPHDTTFTISDASICAGDDFVVTSNDTLQTDWYSFDGNTYNSVTPTGLTFTYNTVNAEIGDYFYAVLDTGSCRDTIKVPDFEVREAGGKVLTSDVSELPATLSTTSDASEYTWYRGFVALETTTTNTYDVTTPGNYRVRKDTAFCDVVSNFVRLCNDTSFTFEKDNITICSATPADIEVNGAFSMVTWYVNGFPQTADTTSSIFTVSTQPSQVYATIRTLNGCLYKTDSVAVTSVDVSAIDTTITYLADTAIIDGAAVTLKATVDADSILWSDNSTTYQTTVNTIGDYSFTKYYQGCEVLSETITVRDSSTVVSSLDPGAISADQTICSGGQPVAFTSVVAATGGVGTLVYAWQQSTNGTTWATATNSTDSDIYSAGVLTQTTYYRRSVTDDVTTIFTDSVVVTVSTGPLDNITVSATVATLCSGSDATINLSTSETGVDYQLLVNNSLVGVSTSGTGGKMDLTVPASELIVAGDYEVSVNATLGACQSVVLSDTAGFTVSSSVAPVITQSANLCASANTVLSAAPDVTGNTYQWYIDGYLLAKGTEAKVTAYIEGDYSVDITSVSGCSGTSNVISVTYDTKAVNPTFTKVGTALQATQTGAGYTYQWYVEYQGKVLAIVGATGASYIPIYSGVYYLSINTGISTCTRISAPSNETGSSTINIARVSLTTTATSIYIPVESISSTIQVIPNPALEDFDVVYTSGSTGTMFLSIIDMNGVEVISEQLYKEGFTATVHVSDLDHELNAGVYLIKIIDGGAVYFEKVMIE